MLQEKSKEIRLQFLEEATENLNTIESAILVLALSPQVDNQRIDAALRAAHSIKGGAAMTGFQTLSDLAHSMEDVFKVLKKLQHLIETQLESLLLTAVDHLRQVIILNRQGAVIDNEWLETHVNPIFEQLHLTLGRNLTPEDTETLLEDGQNMAAMMFETEVEGCLERLESVLASGTLPGLLEETSTMAQELGGLGEMLELTAFTSLCESVIQHLEANPERVEEIARMALQEWRLKQVKVLSGLVDTIPTQIDLVDLEDVSRNKPNRQSQVGDAIKLIRNFHLDIHLKCVVNLIETLGDQVAVFQRFCARRLPTYTKVPGRTVLGDESVFPLVNVPLMRWIASCKLEASVKPKDKSPDATALPRQKNAILVVDDSESVRSLLSLTLEAAGYQVEVACDGQDALEKLNSGLQVQAVISDIGMPRLGGYNLLDSLKSSSAFKQLPIVILTDRDGDEYRRLAMNLGAAAYFSKPCNEQELIKTLQRILENEAFVSRG